MSPFDDGDRINDLAYIVMGQETATTSNFKGRRRRRRTATVRLNITSSDLTNSVDRRNAWDQKHVETDQSILK